MAAAWWPVAPLAKSFEAAGFASAAPPRADHLARLTEALLAGTVAAA